jgi:hypothetical protein
VGSAKRLSCFRLNSNLLPSEHTAALLRIVGTVFCTPGLSGKELAAKFLTCKFFRACAKFQKTEQRAMKIFKVLVSKDKAAA